MTEPPRLPSAPVGRDVRRREFRLPRWTLWAAVAFLVLVGASMLAGVVLPSESDRLASECRRLRELGYATTVGEWNGASGPVALVAGEALLAADAALVAEFGEKESWREPGPWRSDLPEPWWEGCSDEELLALDALLARLEPYIVRVEAASAAPRLGFRLREEDGWVEDGAVKPLRRLSAVLGALVRRPQQPGDAVRAIRLRLTLARRIERSSLITGMVALAFSVAATRELRDRVESGADSARAVRGLLDTDLSMRCRDRFSLLVRAEIVGTARLHAALLEGRLAGSDGSMLRAPSDAEGQMVQRLLLGSYADALRVLQDAAELGEVPFAERAARLAEIERNAPRLARTAAVIPPALARKCAQADAALRLARVAIAVKECHETTAAEPASLDDLRGAFAGESVPQDPYTDAPFVYEVMDDRVRIASAGRLPGDDPVTEGELRERGLVWEFRR